VKRTDIIGPFLLYYAKVELLKKSSAKYKIIFDLDKK